jgi:hypothetical protein
LCDVLGESYTARPEGSILRLFLLLFSIIIIKKILFSRNRCRNPVWLLGVYAPASQKSFFLKYLKIMKKILSMHLDILCSLTKFCKKELIFMSCVKKTNFYATKLLFT